MASDHRHCLGLYISPDLLVLSESRVEGGRPAIRKSAQIAVPPMAGEPARMGTLSTEFLSDTAKLAELIKPVLAQGGWKAKRMVVTLSPEFGFSRFFVMPAVERRFWRRSVPLEAKKYIPFPLDELKYDFQVFTLPSTPEGRGRMGVLFAVSAEKNIDSLKTLAGLLGKKLAAVELSAVSAGRVCRGVADGGAPGAILAQAHIDAQSAYVMVHGGGVPFIAREAHWTGELKDRRRVDLEGSIDFARETLGFQNIRVLLSGSVDLADWTLSFLRDGLGELEQADLSKALGVAQPDWPLLAASGASLRFSSPGQVTVDISQAYQTLSDDLRVLRVFSLIGGALLGLLLLLSLDSHLQTDPTARSLENLFKETASIDGFKGLPRGQITETVERAKKQAAFFDDIMGPRDYVSTWFSILARALPDGVWIDALNFEAPLGARGAAKSLMMKGFSEGADKNGDLSLANQFRDALKKDAEFSRIFPECELSFEASRVDQEFRGTYFSLRCARRAPPRLGGGK